MLLFIKHSVNRYLIYKKCSIKMKMSQLPAADVEKHLCVLSHLIGCPIVSVIHRLVKEKRQHVGGVNISVRIDNAVACRNIQSRHGANYQKVSCQIFISKNLPGAIII